MRNDIERMNVKYPKMHVKLSVEANIIKDGNGLDLREEEFEEFDFVIAGYHYGLFGCQLYSATGCGTRDLGSAKKSCSEV